MSETIDTTKFMGLESELSSLSSARFSVIPVPYEKTTSYVKGTGKGPAAVVEASSQVELWDEETGEETWLLGIHTAKAVDCRGSETAAFKRIQAAAEAAAAAKPIPFFIGGEHSISQALIPPFLKKHPKLSVLHFDAHADLRPEYEGSTRNHACAMYPVSRVCPVVQAGIRSIGGEEKEFVNSGRVKTFPAHASRDNAKLVRDVLKALGKDVYLTIDVDGFDPSVMPATGTPQPGGFSWYDALDLFRAVCREKNVVGVDVVEVCPMKGSVLTEFNAAKLIYRLMGYLASK